jgi:hypothetical protein
MSQSILAAILPTRTLCQFFSLDSLYLPIDLSLSWAANCAATEDTNGQDYYPDDKAQKNAVPKLRAKANLVDNHNGSAVGLPPKYQPTLPTVGGSEGVIRSYILPGNTTGVVCFLLLHISYNLRMS